MSEKSRPRVLMLTSTLPRWEGDSEPRFVLDLAKHLGTDFEIELLAPHAHGASRHEVLEGIPVTRFRYWISPWQSAAYAGGITWRLKENRWRVFQLPLFLFALVWHILTRIRQEPRISLIHAHWIVPQALAALLARQLAGRSVPIVCTSHGGDLFGLKGRFWTAMKHWVLKRCDSVTVVSTAMATRVQEIAPEVTATVIPMGTDLRNTFVPPPEPRQPPFRKLIFVGRLVEKKGVTHLLDAMRIVAAQYPDVSLDIVGHGPLREELEQKTQRLGLESCVRFLGPIPHAELPVHYQHADIAVFPFVEAASGDQEGFGLVMVEAMGCGCLVLAGHVPAVSEALGEGTRGILVPPGDIQHLAFSIIGAIDDSEASSRKAAADSRGVAHIFDWQVSATRFADIYRAQFALNGTGLKAS